MRGDAFPIRRNQGFFVRMLLIAVAFLGAAYLLWLYDTVPLAIFTFSVAVAALVYAFMTTVIACPACGEAMGVDLGRNVYIRCPACGQYYEGEKGMLWKVEDGRVAQYPVFPVVILRPEAGKLQQPQADLMKTVAVEGGEKAFEFKWPDRCCVCGKPSAGTQGAATKAVNKQAKALGFADENESILVAGIPHCREHNLGASLDILKGELVLKFRSLPYRNDFEKLNGLR